MQNFRFQELMSNFVAKKLHLEKPLYFDPFGQTGLLTLAIIRLTLLAKITLTT